MRSHGSRDKISLAATFWAPCRAAIVDYGRPAMTELQSSSRLIANVETGLAVPSARNLADVFLHCQLAAKKNADNVDDIRGCNCICADVQSEVQSM